MNIFVLPKTKSISDKLSVLNHLSGFVIKETPAADNFIIQTKERSVYWHKYKRKWCHSKWHDYYTVHFFICQPFFWKFLKIFYRKRQPRFTELSPFKSLAIIHHIILTILRVCRSKNHITACFYIIIFIFFSQIKRQPNSGCLLVYLFILQIRDVFLLHYSNLSLYLL